ncbi:hypothetical protein BDV18DRAFT_148334 [Aspergillus unguis]
MSLFLRSFAAFYICLMFVSSYSSALPARSVSYRPRLDPSVSLRLLTFDIRTLL